MTKIKGLQNDQCHFSLASLIVKVESRPFTSLKSKVFAPHTILIS